MFSNILTLPLLQSCFLCHSLDIPMGSERVLFKRGFTFLSLVIIMNIVLFILFFILFKDIETVEIAISIFVLRASSNFDEPFRKKYSNV